MISNSNNKVDDLQHSYLLKNASYAGSLELPELKSFKGDLNVKALVPFSERARFCNNEYALAFFERDKKFKDVLQHPEKYVKEFKNFKFAISLDCSMYRDAPLIAQLANLNQSRRISYYFQSQGIDMLPLIRWGSDLTYTTKLFHEPPSFTGIKANTPVCVSNYGCYKSRADKYFFRNGFEAMLSYLHPSVVLLYGSFDRELRGIANKHECKVVHHVNWTAYIHQVGAIDG